MSLTAASLILAIASLLVSVYVAARNWGYSETNVRYASRNQYMNALFDVDRQLIERPELWTIYDGHFMAAARADDLASRGRREAFLYFHFNLFEVVYNDYNNVLALTADDAKYWASWDKWIRDFFRASTEARQVFTSGAAQGIFFSDFSTYVNGVIKETELNRRGSEALVNALAAEVPSYRPPEPSPVSPTRAD